MDIKDLANKLEDADNKTATQNELNKKRESELVKLKFDLEEANIAHEGTLSALRQNHNNSMAEMGEKIDLLNKVKAKSEIEKAKLVQDLHESRATLDEAVRDRANYERNGRHTEVLIVEANQKLDDIAHALNEAEISWKKLQVENQDLTRQIEETEYAIATLNKSKFSITTQLNNTKKFTDDEARDKASLLAKFKTINGEVSRYESNKMFDGKSYVLFCLD